MLVGGFWLSVLAFGVLLSFGVAVELPAAPPLASVLDVPVVLIGPDSGVPLVGAPPVCEGLFGSGCALGIGALWGVGFVELPPIGVVSLIGAFWLLLLLAPCVSV